MESESSLGLIFTASINLQELNFVICVSKSQFPDITI